MWINIWACNSGLKIELCITLPKFSLSHWKTLQCQQKLFLRPFCEVMLLVPPGFLSPVPLLYLSLFSLHQEWTLSVRKSSRLSWRLALGKWKYPLFDVRFPPSLSLSHFFPAFPFCIFPTFHLWFTAMLIFAHWDFCSKVILDKSLLSRATVLRQVFWCHEMGWRWDAFSKISCWNVGPPLFQFCLLSVAVHHFHRLKGASCPWELDHVQCVSEFSLSSFSRLQLMGYGWGYWKGARKCFVPGLALGNYTISAVLKPCWRSSVV